MTMFTAEDVKAALKSELAADIIIKDITASTNLDVKELAAKGAPEGTVVIAGEQTAGRGRLGRSFWSPRNTGLYMSVLLRPELSAADALAITTCAAPAVCEAVEGLCDTEAGIKWVNDIYIGGRKVCGILTESVIAADGRLDSAVLGIGVNVADTEFPADITDKAGSLHISADTRPRLAAAILERFFAYYRKLPEKAYLPEYRRRSILTGKVVEYEQTGELRSAKVTGIDDEAGLIVIGSDGREQHLSSGEVRIIMKH
ncbi:MAG: biotin--[Ruminiclostridium sp.]|nr:biotin--[acetyl-CoA-carboxylase] ligase [Ruminiclostridium sp.]